jgi:hypothetical protein
LFLLLTTAACGARSGLGDGAAATDGGTGACVGAPSTTPVVPLLWYPFDGDATNAGSLGHAYDGQAQGVSWVQGKLGQAAEIGTGWIDLPGTRNVLSSTPTITIAFWLAADFETLGGEPFFDCRSSLAGFQSYHGEYSDTMVTTCAGGGMNSDCGSFDDPLLGFHHVIYRHDATQPLLGLDLFLDGEPAVAVTDHAGTYLGAQVNDIWLGKDHAGSGWVSARHHIDDLRVYGTVLTPADQCASIVGGCWDGARCEVP